ncbi:hypothetical protein L1987_44644 [Smallanthus sonchifolius]|uniref:Uncharacterized protein n=1 Tax=Smallanthus sonchifolius TaxID=185202 RepID=A0ACB9GRB0_9ASTR|nr:hypothetical protein L1987_44644 [Smallanthus sonchifolius]
MEIFEAKMMKDETLSGNDDERILKLEETVGGDLGVVVVMTKVVEKTEKLGRDDEIFRIDDEASFSGWKMKVVEGGYRIYFFHYNSSD